jgi:hypothetical protein
MSKTAGAQIKALDVGNLLDYKKKDGVKEAEAVEAKKEEKAKVKTTSTKVQQAEAKEQEKTTVKSRPTKVQQAEAKKEENKGAFITTKAINQAIESPYKQINDIKESEDKRMVSVDQYKSEQAVSISDVKSKQESDKYNFEQGFKNMTNDIENAMSKITFQSPDVNIYNNATYTATGGQLESIIKTSPVGESSRMFGG